VEGIPELIPDDLSWPRHMATKRRIDIHDFCTAYLVAHALHEKAIPAEILRSQCRDAIEHIEERDYMM
jgi:hypothetical protein